MSYAKHLLKKACERCEEGNLDTCDNTLSCPVYALYVEATKKEKVIYKQDSWLMHTPVEQRLDGILRKELRQI